jgi:L-ascorbate metabolism protein UlaG (beta-lactamase superfamily)
MNRRVAQRIAIALIAVLVFAGSAYRDFFTPTEASEPSTEVIDQYSRYYLPQSDEQPKDGSIKVTWYGTTTLLLDDGETQLLIDAFITRPSLETVFVEQEIQTNTAAVDALLSRTEFDRPPDSAEHQRLTALFTAHSHFDHALDVAYLVQQSGVHLYGSESTLNIGRGGGLTENQMTLYNTEEQLTLGQFTVTVLPSKHSPPSPGVNDDLGKVIEAPLQQPATPFAYVEGGSFDFLIQHGDRSILIKPSANYIEGALDDVRADVLFLATATLGNQEQAFRDTFYEQIVGKVQPQLVIPIHWDNFFLPLSPHLVALDAADLTIGFDFLSKRLEADQIKFGIMQGYQSVMLFSERQGA